MISQNEILLCLKLGVQNRLSTPDCTNLKLYLLVFEILDGIFEANDLVDFVCFETDDGVDFSNLLSNRVENVIKIKAERRLTSTLTIVAVIFGLLTLNADQEGEAHRQNQLRGKM